MLHVTVYSKCVYEVVSNEQNSIETDKKEKRLFFL